MGREIQAKDSPRPGGRGQSRRPWGLVEIKAAITWGRGEAAESEGGWTDHTASRAQLLSSSHTVTSNSL